MKDKKTGNKFLDSLKTISKEDLIPSAEKYNKSVMKRRRELLKAEGKLNGSI